MLPLVKRLQQIFFFFFFNDTATTEIYTLSLHDALPIYAVGRRVGRRHRDRVRPQSHQRRSEEHTSELQSRSDLVCRLLLEKKKLPCIASLAHVHCVLLTRAARVPLLPAPHLHIHYAILT